MADAYARENDAADEFALYESQLNELGAKTAGLPLTSSASAPPPAPEPGTVNFYVRVQDPDSVNSDANAAQQLNSQRLAQLPTRRSLPEGTAYASVLDRYLGRLTATGQLPRALTVLRAQLDRNPNDPLLYERLATFFQQNNLSAQQEHIYQQALAKFQQPSYYDKLARLYLREQKRETFATLTRQVTDIFSGTDLDRFFANVNPTQPIGPQLALELNLYAAKRFPHDLVFTRNLLKAYQATASRDSAANGGNPTICATNSSPISAVPESSRPNCPNSSPSIARLRHLGQIPASQTPLLSASKPRSISSPLISNKPLHFLAPSQISTRQTRTSATRPSRSIVRSPASTPSLPPPFAL
jgi:tetratricopeptide (TPR) repeat protein